MSENILVYDVGTTSVKTALFDILGTLISSVSVPYYTTYNRLGWAEQDPYAFWNAAIQGTHTLLDSIDKEKYSITVISLSGHMNGMLAIDDKGEPAYPQIIHCDTRSTKEVEFIKSLFTQEQIYERTGNRIDEFLTLPKLLWLKNNIPSAYKKSRFIINAKDFMRSQLTGIIGTTDYSDASLTGALDMRNKRWDEEYLETIGISQSIFPTIHPSTEIAGFLTIESASLLHLPSGIPVCYGAGDASSATRGALIKDKEEGYASIGSSAWISTLHSSIQKDSQMRMQHFYDLDGLKINVCGTVQSAGTTLEWAKNNFFPTMSFEKIEKELETLSNENHIISLPYFMGERTPHWDAHARGNFFGIQVSSSPLDLTRSLYEGVAFGLFEIMEVYGDLGIPISTFTLLGGGAKSRFWSEMIASVFGMPMIVHPHYQSATSFGAALGAMVAIKVYPSLEDAISKIPLSHETIEPDIKKHEMYSKYFSLYKKMYQSLKPLYLELYHIQKSVEENIL